MCIPGCVFCKDLSENNLGRDSAISLSISDALRVNTGLETLILARMTPSLVKHVDIFYPSIMQRLNLSLLFYTHEISSY